MTLNDIQRRLRAVGIEEAAWEARLLAARFTGLSDARLVIMGGEELDAPGLEEAVARRENREPLQYILGEWSFMGLSFSVSPACLIPRPDTETLVEYAVRQLPNNAKVADLCTGSGCIGIALAHHRPDITVAAVDLLVPGVGELIGGSQREDNYEILKARIEELGMNPEDYWWYLELRKYGTTPHAGFGMGFERMIMLLTGISNIRDVLPFPRTTGSLEF